ncbi:hypothetical protein L0F63_007287, partial [Massospora cicadina]
MVGNVLLIMVLLRVSTGWHRFSLQLVVPMAVMDLLSSVLVTLKSLIGMFMGSKALLNSDWFCVYIGSPSVLSACSCMILTSAVAASRYIHVVHSHPIPSIYGWPIVGFVIVGVAAILSAAMVVNGMVTDVTHSYCKIGGSGVLRQLAYQMSSCVILFGLVIISLCYLGVYFKCRANLTNSLPDRI